VLLAVATAQAAPYLVRDINTAVVVGARPSGLTDVAGTLFFAASDRTSGRELWKTDGTAAGTVRVADIVPGAGDSAPEALTNVSGTLFFTATQPATGRELWKSDGTAEGTVRVADIDPGPGSSTPGGLIGIGGVVFFTAQTPGAGREVWRSDGTAAGTAPLFDPLPGPGNALLGRLLPFDGAVFFLTLGELWRSDGTPDGTMAVTSFRSGSELAFLQNLTRVGNTLFFEVEFDDGERAELWKSDGTATGTLRVADIPVPEHDGPRGFLGAGQLLFFKLCGRQIDGCDLWRSDGTEAGTFVLSKLYPSFDWDDEDPPPLASQALRDAAGMAGTVFFWKLDASESLELWKTDGTLGGTLRVAPSAFTPDDYEEGWSDWQGGQALGANGSLFFSDCDEAGCELWKSDGTPAGTVRVADINPGPESSRLGFGAVIGTTVYFVADEPTAGGEIWRTDGTEGGTTRVADIHPNDVTAHSRPLDLAGIDGALFFAATGRGSSRLPCRSDGTAAGTVELADVAPGRPYGFLDGAGTVFFAVDDVHPRQLWKTDGTPQGTVRVANLLPATPGDGTQRNLSQTIGTTLFLVALDPLTGQCGLWKSDGTETGTVRLPVPGDSCYGFRQLTDFGGTLYLNAWETDTWRLWRSDGTPEGTERVTDLALDRSTPLAVLNGVLYFTADVPGTGLELWRTDGTEAGTFLVADIDEGPNGSAPIEFTVVDGMLFFTAFHYSQVWRSDGTAAGTVRLAALSSEYVQDLHPLAGRLVFRSFPSDPGFTEHSVWRSDGTAAGTVRVGSPPGTFPLSPPTEAGGMLFFEVEAGFERHVWGTDGTAQRTGRVVDIPPLPGQWSALEGVGDLLFFTLDDPATGIELWALRVTAPGAPCGDGVLHAGEECDDGNSRNGDCCTSTCRLEPAGSPCASDANVCTDDVCDGAGACQHVDNAAPCSDGDACTSDVCSEGTCVSTYEAGACVEGFLCHDVRPARRRRGKVGALRVKPMQQLCAPASVGGAAVRDGVTHLAGHRLAGRPSGNRRRNVRLTNLLGELVFDTRKPDHVLVPSVVEAGGAVGEPVATRYLCSQARSKRGPLLPSNLEVRASDWLGSVQTYRVKEPVHLCEGERGGVQLLCYTARPLPHGSAGGTVRGVKVENELGQPVVNAGGTRRLCIRSVLDPP
jgi:ELWxxDGT repeat protein/cysteine-rich repeat protein